MAPFLAFKKLREEGSTGWKWLFLGKEDTLFFVDAARQVVQDLNSSLPYLLSGALLPLLTMHAPLSWNILLSSREKHLPWPPPYCINKLRIRRFQVNSKLHSKACLIEA